MFRLKYDAVVCIHVILKKEKGWVIEIKFLQNYLFLSLFSHPLFKKMFSLYRCEPPYIYIYVLFKKINLLPRGNSMKMTGLKTRSGFSKLEQRRWFVAVVYVCVHARVRACMYACVWVCIQLRRKVFFRAYSSHVQHRVGTWRAADGTRNF